MANIIYDDCDKILHNTCCDWNKLSNKKIFLTGGTGLFGKWFLHSFLYINNKLKLGATLSVLSRSPQVFLKKNPWFDNLPDLSFIPGDIRSFKFPSDAYDLLIHAATPASAKLQAENPDEMRSIIVDGAKNIIDFAKTSGVKKILFTSSGGVYGKQPSTMKRIPETYSPEPITVYGKGKLEAERMFIDSDIDTVIGRCFAVVGPYLPLDIHYAMGNFIRDAMNGDEIIITGDGRPIRSYLYMGDLISWLWAIFLAAKPFTIYNIGSDVGISIADLANTVASCFTKEISVKVLRKNITDEAAPQYVPDTKLIKTELKCNQTYSLLEGIKRTIKWYHNE